MRQARAASLVVPSVRAPTASVNQVMAKRRERLETTSRQRRSRWITGLAGRGGGGGRDDGLVSFKNCCHAGRERGGYKGRQTGKAPPLWMHGR
jgi:hypothetical protein